MNKTETAFSEHAIEYDVVFTDSAIGKLQRDRVWKYLSAELKADKHRDVLEINCGTGADAIWLSDHGFNVTATDLSGEMIAKAEGRDRSASVRFIQMDMKQVRENFPPASFDLIFSDFGGMNCLDAGELKTMIRDLHSLLKKNGRLIMVIMGRNCKWEQLYFKRKGDPERAFRRRSENAVIAKVGGIGIPIWYHSPDEVKNIASETFSVRKVIPVGIALPPSYLENYFRKRKMFLRILNIIENMFGNRSRFADRADHYLIDLIRK